MRSPDAAWVSYERDQQLSIEDHKRFAPICPDFIIEIRSEMDTIPEIQSKMEEWMENGCRLGWLIDADEEKIYIYAKGQTLRTMHGFDASIDGGSVLPGFTLDLSELRLE